MTFFIAGVCVVGTAYFNFVQNFVSDLFVSLWFYNLSTIHLISFETQEYKSFSNPLMVILHFLIIFFWLKNVNYLPILLKCSKKAKRPTHNPNQPRRKAKRAHPDKQWYTEDQCFSLNLDWRYELENHCWQIAHLFYKVGTSVFWLLMDCCQYTRVLCYFADRTDTSARSELCVCKGCCCMFVMHRKDQTGRK